MKVKYPEDSKMGASGTGGIGATVVLLLAKKGYYKKILVVNFICEVKINFVNSERAAQSGKF